MARFFLYLNDFALRFYILRPPVPVFYIKTPKYTLKFDENINILYDIMTYTIQYIVIYSNI